MDKTSKTETDRTDRIAKTGINQLQEFLKNDVSYEKDGTIRQPEVFRVLNRYFKSFEDPAVRLLMILDLVRKYRSDAVKLQRKIAKKN